MNQKRNEDFLQRHEEFLKHCLATIEIPSTKIRQAIEYSMFPGGKRFRPLLVYLCGQLLEVEIKLLDSIAAAVEMTHCYSLIHDDLPAMDNDDFRRGLPSCHKQFDEATAILAGDGLQALAIQILLSSEAASADVKIKIARALLDATGINGMISGQSLDLSELNGPDLKEPKLKLIHHLKTGCLISACFEMVMIARENLPPEAVNALHNFGQHLGLVFQMQDDYLDAYATELLGKSRASDSENFKTTFANLYSKQELLQTIHELFNKASEALSIFGQEAQPLIKITQQLQQRSNL